MKDKVILAYSGGLDTSVILKWLANKGFDVIAYVADVGQNEDYKAIEEKAYATGASKVYIEDLKKPLVTDYIYPALKANTIYEGKYMLGTSLARPIIAKRHIEIAKKEGTKYVAHGATGKGNDQVRFEFGYYMNMPDVKIISPWKDEEWLSQFEGRSDMLKYAEENGIPVKATTKKPYSEDENMIHISHEAGILENPSMRCPEDVYSLTLSPQKAADKETILTIEFKDGTPVSVKNENDGTVVTEPVEMIMYLNKMGHDNATGAYMRLRDARSSGRLTTTSKVSAWTRKLCTSGTCSLRNTQSLSTTATGELLSSTCSQHSSRRARRTSQARQQSLSTRAM